MTKSNICYTLQNDILYNITSNTINRSNDMAKLRIY